MHFINTTIPVGPYKYKWSPARRFDNIAIFPPGRGRRPRVATEPANVVWPRRRRRQYRQGRPCGKCTWISHIHNKKKKLVLVIWRGVAKTARTSLRTHDECQQLLGDVRFAAWQGGAEARWPGCAQGRHLDVGVRRGPEAGTGQRVSFVFFVSCR